MHVNPDRTMETSPTTGTGDLALAGPVDGFRGFVAAVGNGNTVEVVIWNVDVPTEFEEALITVTDGSPDTIARTTVFGGSNGTSLVNFSAGTKRIFAVTRTALLARLEAAGGIDVPPRIPNAEDEEYATTDGFAWVNQGAATATYADHVLILKAPASASSSVRMRTKSITTPTGDYKYRTKVHLAVENTTSFYGGLVLRESGTGKLAVCWIARESSIVYVAGASFTSPTSGPSLINSASVSLSTQHGECLRDIIVEIEKSGSTLFFRFLPPGGGQPIAITSVAVTTPFTTRPDEWGCFADVVNGSKDCYAVFPWSRRIS